MYLLICAGGHWDPRTLALHGVSKPFANMKYVMCGVCLSQFCFSLFLFCFCFGVCVCVSLIVFTFNFSRWTCWASGSNSLAQKNYWQLDQEKTNTSADKAENFKLILQNSTFLGQYSFRLECCNTLIPGTDFLQVRQRLFLLDCLFLPSSRCEQ